MSLGGFSRSGLRMKVLLLVVVSLFVALIAKLWTLQVIQAKSAQVQTLNQGVVKIYTPAPRGRILDRDGRVLVDNKVVPVVEVQKNQYSNTAMLARLAVVLGMTLGQVQTTLNNGEYTDLQYVPVMEHATAAEMLYIDERPTEFPGVIATTITQAHVTALGEYAGNLLGYVGPIDAAMLKEPQFKGYQNNAMVGFGGIEQEFNSELEGKPGVEEVETSASGQPLGVLSKTAPVPGANIRLSIDGEVQKVAVQALQAGAASAQKVTDPVTRRKFESPGGSVVVEDPQNGQILALATNPTYDPNLFNNGGISQANYDKLNPCATAPQSQQQICSIENPQDPLLNRPIQGLYAPGSTFKLITATAGLKYGLITPTSLYDDTGSMTVGGQVYHDDGGYGYGEIALPEAITVSSDNYFNFIGAEFWEARAKYGEDALQKIADQYGLNSATGIDLPDENGGVIPTPALYAKQHKEDPQAYPYGDWYTGDSMITAIGQGEVLVTPLALANAYASFANGGTRYVPQIALDAQTGRGKVLQSFHTKVSGHSPRLSRKQRAALIQGFEGVVQNPSGTAYTVFGGTPLENYDIAGKTGTAQVTGEGKQDTSVFMSFAPATHAKYLVDCFMEDSGYGASIAAPVVRDVWDQIYHQPLQTPVYGATGGGNNL